MMSELSRPRWKTYEQQVFELIRQHFPSAKVRKNVRIRGRFSKRKRQIDVLITEKVPSGHVKTVVDAKFFRRRIDVKAVDGLAGFVEDVGAQRGMLITSLGYTQAALKRAFYGPSDLELDVLNFSELQHFQGFEAIPYSGEKALLITAPFGWVVDGTQGQGWLAGIYQRGLNAEIAKRNKELIYINSWNRRKDPLTAAELDEFQVAQLRLTGKVRISHRPTIQRPDAVTRLRIAEVESYGRLEVTGFLEFDDVIFFAVLLTPIEKQRPNIRRLESVLQRAVPITLKRDNTAVINQIQRKLANDLPTSERADLLRELGHWFRDMGTFPEAKQALDESLLLGSDTYQRYLTIKELLPVLAALRERGRALEVMGQLLRLDPGNPTVFNDCFAFASGWIERADLLRLLDTLKIENPNNQIVSANCDFYSGNLLVGKPRLARARFLAAKRLFRQVFPRNHQVFHALRAVLSQKRLQAGGYRS